MKRFILLLSCIVFLSNNACANVYTVNHAYLAQKYGELYLIINMTQMGQMAAWHLYKVTEQATRYVGEHFCFLTQEPYMASEEYIYVHPEGASGLALTAIRQVLPDLISFEFFFE